MLVTKHVDDKFGMSEVVTNITVSDEMKTRLSAS